ncbi:MAG: outer membrane lipoprotein LolB [Thiotrichales bacterium]|nr:MAG: outer membrane lipoprotein LolB [Thiotrichales bacterium]
MFVLGKKYRSLSVKLTIFVSMFMLFACSNTHYNFPAVHNPQQSWRQHYLDISNLSKVRASGIISIRTSDQVVSANFIWEQNADQYNLTVYDSFGLHEAHIYGDSQHANLVWQKKHYVDSSVTHLMQRNLGWSLPMNGMLMWIKAIPSNKALYTVQLNRYGFAYTMKQLGWRFTYTNYMKVKQYALPGKIIMHNKLAHVVLVIKHWY